MSLYHEAAEFLTKSPTEGGSLKARVFRRKNLKSSPNQLYALVIETCRWSEVLTEIIERSDLLKLERKLTPALALLLAHDLLISKGGIALPQSHGLRVSMERHKGRLTSELTLARLRRKAPSMAVLKDQVLKASAGEESQYPRWVRVNSLRSTLEDQLETTFSNYARAQSLDEIMAAGSEKKIYIDPHVPNLVAITQGTDLTKTEAYISGKVILQDKASCFPAYLLDPRSEDGHVVDACAAPGNKTTHLAAILHDHEPEFEAESQIIYAFEKDSKRAQTLEKMVKAAGSKEVTRIAFGQDFLQVDPHAERFAQVGALLLDPSCSGSGIVGRDSMPELHMPRAPESKKAKASDKGAPGNPRKRKHAEVEDDEERRTIRDDDGNETVLNSERDVAARLEALAAFQLSIILHAFQFPAATKVTYSTCSIHDQENEEVVMRALASDVAKKRGWRILKRGDQVAGMRDWPVRGRPKPCNGETEIAEGCIRSFKNDGRGVMGFFVAGFVRTREGDGTGSSDDGPYVRDEDGMILRDVLGMPVLKSTGAPVSLEGKTQEKRAEQPVSSEEEEEDDDAEEEDDDEEEWEGFGS
ncbi:S-adenosyl-L-methionine-dependent methyltransferase [Stachybotrys elegans]|uniref:S-adenosyl-L-methionine-dependent methyltransferase n=1 Tax=Stachybotrys elegans TaxID=80388 RepID=A0A8K0T6S9_9HYPO|nr:S-adenosyl-L-methionine-dependent methyltransferase [Stachybotrys elegans]